MDKTGNHFDLRQKIIRNTGPYYDGLFSDNDQVSKAYADSKSGKQDIAIADKIDKDDVFIKDKSGNLDMGGKEIVKLKR